MRAIPEGMQAKLDAGITTLCHCWTLTRRDGTVQGFTDHDDDIVLDGVTHRAGTGFMASEATSRFDLSIDGSEISGALADDSLNDDDLAAGRYDAAAIQTWLVDWSDTVLRVLMARATLGEVKREGQGFHAELRGPAERLSQESGRLYTATCGADLGDARCGVDLAQAELHADGVIVDVRSDSVVAVSGLDAFPAGLFSAGRLTWTDGANQVLAIEIKEHRVADGEVTLALWQAMPQPLAPGDSFTVTAGCDKRFATCRERFANAINFRGFPHIPGNDFIVRYPIPGEGGSGDALSSAG